MVVKDYIIKSANFMQATFIYKIKLIGIKCTYNFLYYDVILIIHFLNFDIN